MPQKKKIADKTDKRRRAKVTVGHDADGDPIVKYASGRTQKQLDESAEELRKTYIGGEKVQRDALFGDYCAEWYETYKKPTIGASSQANYRSVLNQHILPVFVDRQLRSITAMELQRYLNTKADMKPTTITYVKAILKGAFQTAYTQGLIDRDPTIGMKAPSTDSNSRRELTAEETDAVLTVAADHPEGLLLHILYYTGCRLGEALGLQWRDIDFTAHTISVERDIDFVTNEVGTLKTKSSRRTIPMPAALEAVLKPLRGFGTAFIVQSENGSFMPQKTLTRRWKRLTIAIADANLQAEQKAQGEKAKLTIETKEVEYNKRTVAASILTAHYFRHNYATILYEAGVDVYEAARILGHSRVSTTLEIYTHLSQKHQAENNEKVRNVFKK